MGPSEVASVVKMASQGSPAVLQAIGRLYGLGEPERDQLLGDGVPTWAIVALSVGAGFFIGVRVYKRWPDRVPALIQGK